ncbi:MAG: SdrD B-like domain-containing protein, partial [Planctomycetales bacterium]
GTYTLTETQPATFLDGKDTIGTPGGTTTNDKFSNVVLTSGVSGTENNFGEVKAASLSGYVYHDANNDGARTGETGIASATVTLTGTNDLGASVSVVATTNASGYYEFTGLRPGTYVLTETQPASFLDGKDTVGTPGGTTTNDKFSNVVLTSGVSGSENNFGEVKAASLSGYIYHDANNDGARTGETGIASATVTLTGTNDLGASVSVVATTNASGYYEFTGLRPGTYVLTETQPASFLDGKDTVGTPGGTTTNDKFSNVVLTSGVSGTENNFGEVKTASLSGYVYVDGNNDGLRSGDAGIAGATVTLTGTNDLGTSVNVVATTNSSGFYQFTGLRPGTYVLTETQPSAYLDGKDTIGTPGGTTTNDKFSNVVLNSGVSGTENNFGELGAVINGKKFLDVTGNGLSNDDTALAGASFKLYVDSNSNNTLDANDAAYGSTVTSTSNGTFSFRNLPAGVYFVQELAMTGYVRTGPTLSDYYKVNVTAGSTNGVYNFANAEKGCDCSIDTSSIKYYINGSSTPVTNLRGNVNQGDTVEVRFNVTEAGATFSLVSYTAPAASFDANTASQQVIFDTDTITNATVGTKSLKVLVPNCYFQIDFVCGLPIDTFGPAGSNIFYTPQGRLLSADNDGIQAYSTSSLSGNVYKDSNNNGSKDTGEGGIFCVTVKLSGKDIYGNTVNLTTTTNSSGYYVFNNLKASDSNGYKISEVQPAGYNDGKDSVGSLGGTAAALGSDLLTTKQVNTNKSGTNYNFGERPLPQMAAGAMFTEASAPLLTSPEGVISGEVRVAVDGLPADLAAAGQARIQDAINVLNSQLGVYQVHFSLVSGPAAADAQVHLRVSSTSDLGNASQGVLGATSGHDVTLLSGWNWYVGADPRLIQPGQYDFQTVVAHELAHTVGLGESTDPTSVMFQALAAGQVRRTLSAADLHQIALTEGGVSSVNTPAAATPGLGARFAAATTPGAVPAVLSGGTTVTPEVSARRDLSPETRGTTPSEVALLPGASATNGRRTTNGSAELAGGALSRGLSTAALDSFYTQFGAGRAQLS